MNETASKSGIDKITIMHGWIIGYLYENKTTDVFQKDIESSFGIARSTVTNILKLMEKKGYIVRKSVASDARLKKLVLIEKGEEIHAKIEKVIDENETQLNNILTDEERKTFIYLINKLKDGLKNN